LILQLLIVLAGLAGLCLLPAGAGTSLPRLVRAMFARPAPGRAAGGGRPGDGGSAPDG
jgi:hypothetical protein